MHVTSKGQITIPKHLRERFGITGDTDIEFREEDGKLVLVKQHAPSPVARIRGRIKKLPAGRDVDDYLELTRGKP